MPGVGLLVLLRGALPRRGQLRSVLGNVGVALLCQLIRAATAHAGSGERDEAFAFQLLQHRVDRAGAQPPHSVAALAALLDDLVAAHRPFSQGQQDAGAHVAAPGAHAAAAPGTMEPEGAPRAAEGRAAVRRSRAGGNRRRETAVAGEVPTVVVASATTGAAAPGTMEPEGAPRAAEGRAAVRRPRAGGNRRRETAVVGEVPSVVVASVTTCAAAHSPAEETARPDRAPPRRYRHSDHRPLLSEHIRQSFDYRHLNDISDIDRWQCLGGKSSLAVAGVRDAHRAAGPGGARPAAGETAAAGSPRASSSCPASRPTRSRPPPPGPRRRRRRRRPWRRRSAAPPEATPAPEPCPPAARAAPPPRSPAAAPAHPGALPAPHGPPPTARPRQRCAAPACPRSPSRPRTTRTSPRTAPRQPATPPAKTRPPPRSPQPRALPSRPPPAPPQRRTPHAPRRR